jgi:hypothetical protein
VAPALFLSTAQEALHHNCVWVKTLDRCGKITSHDWYTLSLSRVLLQQASSGAWLMPLLLSLMTDHRTANYKALRVATNTTFPGYMSHEAVAWHPGADLVRALAH